MTPSKPHAAPNIAQDIARALAAGQHAPEAFRAAVWQRLFTQDAALLRGIMAYRSHPYRRALAVPPVLWHEGSARLLDFGGGGAPVLFVPSLVNRAYVLDLDEGASLLRFLRADGQRPLLLDWGWPGATERAMDLAAHLARLERAICAVGQPLVLAGYCMGGLLALAAALRQQNHVTALALLATPWDFQPAPFPGLELVMAPSGTLPVDAIQTAFAMLDPFALAQKFRAFAALDPASERARRFVVLEDWLNDGIPLPAPVAREVFSGWYGANAPLRGEWRLDSVPVLPGEWRGPTFFAIPSRDRIVPPASAQALATAMPQAVVHVAAAGHIGMVAGQQAEAQLWRPLLHWLRGLG